MQGVRRFYLGASVLDLFVIGCDGSRSVEPTIQPAYTVASGPTVKAPSNTNAIALSESRIDLSWKDNSSNESGFEVHRSTAGTSGTFALLAPTAAGITSYSDGGLTPSTQYCYKVRAFRTAGSKTTYSAFAPTACATTLGPPVPTVPSGTDAKPAIFAAVDVSWVDNSSNEDGFRVERSPNLGSTWTSASTIGPNVTSFHDTGLASEQQVCYRVIAFNGHGDSQPSDADCTTPPAAPTGLTATGVDGPAIDLTWTDNSAVEDGYEVQRATLVFGPYDVVANLTQNAGSYRDTGLPGNTTYFYRVRATKDAGFGDFSNYASAVLASAPPNAPSDTDVMPNSSSVVGITWVDNSLTEEGFRVERSTDGGASWAGGGTTLANEPGFIDGERFSEQQVCYRVIAFNRVGDSPPSNTGCTTPPAGPTNLTATVVDAQTIELTWVDNSGFEDGYEVHRFFPLGDGDSYVIADLSPNSTVYRATVTCWGNDVFAVRAKKDGGFSDFSNSAGAETPPPCQ